MCLVCLVCLVCFVCPVCLVCLACLGSWIRETNPPDALTISISEYELMHRAIDDIIIISLQMNLEITAHA